MADCARGRWNHNLHYGRRVLAMVPDGARDALDVGCREGWLVRCLRSRVNHVVGIDLDHGSLAAARAHDDDEGVEYLLGDFTTYPFEPESFDVVTTIASLHHVDEKAALRRMSELLGPGGLLGVVGLARTRSPRDLGLDLGGVVVTRLHKRTGRYWETPAPKVSPPHSYGELRRMTAIVLPGRRFQRGVMWRYVLSWRKPVT